MSQKLRPVLSLLLKAAASALLLYLALRSVDLSGVAVRLKQVQPEWLGLVFAIMLAQVVLLGLRWREIVAATGVTLSPLLAIRFSLIAIFFNQTLPSTIGGDAARVWMLARHAGSWRGATYSVLIDRAVGLFALAVIVVALLPATFAHVTDPAARGALGLIGIAGLGGPLAFAAIGLLRGTLIERFWATRHATAAARAAWALGSSWQRAFTVGTLSIAIHLLSISAAWAAARAVAVPLDFMLALSIIPPVILISTVPISIAGWGVRESVMIAAFGYAGLAQGDGLVVSLIFGAATFAAGVVGGLVWIVSGEKVSSDASEPAPQDRR
jgi:uncharacterized membrane protein YbhN (UPF0104 family)